MSNFHFFSQDSYGGDQHITVIRTESFLQLRRELRALGPGRVPTNCEHDCSGRLCFQGAELLKIAKDDGGFAGIVLISRAFDV